MPAVQGESPDDKAADKVAQPKDPGEQRVTGQYWLPNGKSMMPTRGCWPPAERSNTASMGQDETYQPAALLQTADEQDDFCSPGMRHKWGNLQAGPFNE